MPWKRIMRCLGGGDGGGEAFEEGHGFEQHVALSSVVGLAQLEAHAAVGEQGEPPLGERRAQSVAQQSLELVAVSLEHVEVRVRGRSRC